MHVDVIVVGQGIAGTCLSFELIRRGLNVLVIDNNYRTSASMVAAGMVNPVVFKRLTKSWQADVLLPEADGFYKALEAELGNQYYERKRFTRIFTSDFEHEMWADRKDEDAFKNYLDLDDDELPNIKADFGKGSVLQASRLDIQKLLIDYRSWLKASDRLMEEDIKIGPEDLEAKQIEGVSFDHIVFAEGSAYKENELFSWVEEKFVKGEVLTLKIPNLNLDRVVSRGFLLVPLGEDIYTLGSNYDWKNLDNIPTDSAKEEILAKLRKVYDGPIEIVEHVAAVRPASVDRRPVLGPHPKYSNAHFFNGMGTKGIMIAPYHSIIMADHIQNIRPVPSDVSIDRFEHLYHE